jgi:hypothetical protein
MAGELADFGRRVSDVVSPGAVRRMVGKAGMAGKKSALEAAAKDLGGDRAFSNWRRRIALSAGYDDTGGSTVRINFRPAGMWQLAEQGRRGSGPIRPKRGKQAVRTPQGLRARSSYGRSRGLNTFTDAVKDAQREVPKAAAKQFREEVARAVRG